MSKSIIKVKVEPCGTKVKDRTEKVYPINFEFSDQSPEKMCYWKPGFEPGAEFRAQIMANGTAEIL